MLALVLFLCEALTEPVSLRRAAYLLGDNATVLEGTHHDYISLQFPPIILVYSKEFIDHQQQYLTVEWKRSLYDDPSAMAKAKKLNGLWLCHTYHILPSDPDMLVFEQRPYLLMISGDIMTIDYGFFQHRFLFRSVRYGPLLRFRKELPTERDRQDFARNPDEDVGLNSLYFIQLGEAVIWWQPTKSRLGKLSILTRYQKQ